VITKTQYTALQRRIFTNTILLTRDLPSGNKTKGAGFPNTTIKQYRLIAGRHIGAL
jgi:hypothetical protein